MCKTFRDSKKITVKTTTMKNESESNFSYAICNDSCICHFLMILNMHLINRKDLKSQKFRKDQSICKEIRLSRNNYHDALLCS